MQPISSPVALTGRIDDTERAAALTLSDLAHRADIHPTSRTAPCPALAHPSWCRLCAATRPPHHLPSHLHPTYFFVDQNKKPIHHQVCQRRTADDMQLPLGCRVPFFKGMHKILTGASTLSSLKKHFIADKAPEGLSFTRFLQTLEGMLDKKAGRGEMDGTYTYKTLLVAGMHFMYAYNYDVDRVKRCVIHYTAPDGRLYPFCAYNSGPVFRDKIEKQFSVPKSEFFKQKQCQ
jgi:uncharacterized radical SAM superfamily Fe-S cluster-containing enzyme